MRLVIAERSVQRPVGILHDVLVKVADFILPADFVVLDCEVRFEVPINLGRPVLATGRVIVDLELNKLKFRKDFVRNGRLAMSRRTISFIVVLSLRGL